MPGDIFANSVSGIKTFTLTQIFSPALTGVPLVLWLMLLSPPWSYIVFSCSLIMDSQTTEISQISQHGQLLPLERLYVCW